MTNLKELYARMNQNFDPTDANAASEVCERSIKLAALCSRALWSDNKGMRMGRDTATEMGVAMLELSASMGLIPSRFSGADADELNRLLDDIWLADRKREEAERVSDHLAASIETESASEVAAELKDSGHDVNDIAAKMKAAALAGMKGLRRKPHAD